MYNLWFWLDLYLFTCYCPTLRHWGQKDFPKGRKTRLLRNHHNFHVWRGRVFWSEGSNITWPNESSPCFYCSALLGFPLKQPIFIKLVCRLTSDRSTPCPLPETTRKRGTKPELPQRCQQRVLETSPWSSLTCRSCHLHKVSLHSVRRDEGFLTNSLRDSSSCGTCTVMMKKRKKNPKSHLSHMSPSSQEISWRSQWWSHQSDLSSHICSVTVSLLQWCLEVALEPL